MAWTLWDNARLSLRVQQITIVLISEKLNNVDSINRETMPNCPEVHKMSLDGARIPPNMYLFMGFLSVATYDSSRVYSYPLNHRRCEL